MSVGIYYTAKRGWPLIDVERGAINQLIETYDDNRFIAAGGEPFCVYADQDLEEDQVFAGATSLPGAEHVVDALPHWLSLISAIRRAIPGSEWRVQLDDLDFPWDEERQEY